VNSAPRGEDNIHSARGYVGFRARRALEREGEEKSGMDS